MNYKLIVVVFASISLIGSGCSKPAKIAVGSKNSTEQIILAEIIAQQIERKLNVEVTRKVNLGDTNSVFNALMGGEIDLYPEYSGTAMTAILNIPAGGAANIVRERVRSEYKNRLKVEWLDPLGFDAAYAIAIPGDIARQANFESLSDVERDRDRVWKLAVTFEFFERPEFLKAFNQNYSIPWAATATRTMEQRLLPHALARSQADMIAVQRTEGGFAGYDVKFLKDDKGILPPLEAAITVKRTSLDKFPGLEEALKLLSGRISEEAMRSMNDRAETKGVPIPQIAREFLNAPSSSLSSTAP